MPARGHRKSDQLDAVLKIRLSRAQRRQVDALAEVCGVTSSALVRDLFDQALAGAGAIKPPKPARNHESLLRAAEVHQLAMQVKKLGTNINQLARQANAGMVPLSRAEVQYMLNQHQLLISRAIAYVEKALG